jgi:hypothetical protein
LIRGIRTWYVSIVETRAILWAIVSNLGYALSVMVLTMLTTAPLGRFHTLPQLTLAVLLWDWVSFMLLCMQLLKFHG